MGRDRVRRFRQTGVDRAALDVALTHGIPAGGWCPFGRLAEDGFIDARYPLEETPTAAYAERTEWNVRDSDATLIVCSGAPSGGTALTISFARRYGRPIHVVDLDGEADEGALRHWLQRHQCINVAGPRESGSPGIYEKSRALLKRVLA